MKHFQNRVAESSLSLPVSAVISILIWFAAGLISRKLWIPLLLTGFSTYLIAEMNTRNTLLRIRSRMMSCVFLWLATMQATIAVRWQTALIQTLTGLCIYLLLFCYKDKKEVPSIFCIALIITKRNANYYRPLPSPPRGEGTAIPTKHIIRADGMV